MKTRNASIEDIDKISKLMLQVAEIHSNARKDIFKEKNREQMKLELKGRLDENENILVMENGKELVGVMIFKIKEVKNHSALKDRNVLWIDELVVDETLRGKGIGTILFGEAKKFAKDKHCDSVELNCWNFNERAIAFYEKCGMKVQRNIMEVKI